MKTVRCNALGRRWEDAPNSAAAAVAANQAAAWWKFGKAKLIAVYACRGTRRRRSDEDAVQLQRRRSDAGSEGTD